MKICFLSILLSILLLSCQNTDTTAQGQEPLSNTFKEYWYGGQAEITSYKLTQARYGELREGTAVMVFVTEPFSLNSYTKADQFASTNIPVLKLNYTKQFITGVYPYSMMTSTFYPLEGESNSLKVSSSSQEWCGHTFMELENGKKYNIDIRSYFEGENESIRLAKTNLEDDLWSIIRKNPKDLLVGELKMIPSFFYLRLMHKETKAYACIASLENRENSSSYIVNYPELSRTVTIIFENQFPHQIIGWEESYPDGFGNKKMLTTKGEKINTIKSAYWQQNSKADTLLRKELRLD